MIISPCSGPTLCPWSSANASQSRMNESRSCDRRMLSSSSLDPRAFVDADSPPSPEVVMDVYGSAMSHDLEERDRLSPCSRGSDPCAQRAENNLRAWDLAPTRASFNWCSSSSSSARTYTATTSKWLHHNGTVSCLHTCPGSDLRPTARFV